MIFVAATHAACYDAKSINVLTPPSSKEEGFFYYCFPHGYFSSIHVLEVDPKKHPIVAVKARGENPCRETVATLAIRHEALAAINGGFWKLNGVPAGALKINHTWFGTPIKPRGAIGWSNATQKVVIDRITTNYSLSECPTDSLIEVVPVSASPYTTKEDWQDLEYIVGGTPVLIQNGCLIEDFTPEQTLISFLVNRDPRTAVGIKSDGNWVFVVVDGSAYKLFGGMTMKELSEFMLDLGCIEALNLDGCGSSTMVIDDKVINEPCGKIKEDTKNVEAVSDAILIL